MDCDRPLKTRSGGGRSVLRAFAPALRLQAFTISARPVEREPLFGEELGEHEVAVLKDLDLDGLRSGKNEAANITFAAPETPHDPSARLDDV